MPTLGAFIKDNRTDLIDRTRVKVATRSSPPANATELEHGVPLFLTQLSETLDAQGPDGTDDAARASSKAHPTIGESAALHGRDLLKFGFTIEQVVHDYGDVCQAVTELAEVRGFVLSTAEFHTLNRCLDNAIASAVASWSEGREREQANVGAEAGDVGKASDTVTRDLSRLVDQARTAFDVIRGGKVAAGGATGTLLHRALLEMRALVDQALRK